MGDHAAAVTPASGRSATPISQPSGRHQIVIVGGGAAGLELATALGKTRALRERADLTLVDRARTHIWKPLLHEVAAGSLDVGRDAIDYLSHASDHGFRYCIGDFIGLDRTNRLVHLSATFAPDGDPITPERSIRYDTLVIAVGSTSNDFGTPGVKSFAISLDTPEQAVRFNQRLVNRFIRAHAQSDPVRPGQLHVSIIGAGATGTELAAELHHTTRQVVAYGLDRIDPEKDLKITLIEAAPRILPAVPERIAEGATAVLRNLGIDVRTHARVVEVRADGILLADGPFVPSELVVWAAGVKGPEVLRDLDGLEANRNAQLVVTATLQTTKDPAVFAIGDCAFLIDGKTDKPIPPRAQAAHQQAAYVAKAIVKRLDGADLAPFVYRDFGSLVSLGRIHDRRQSHGVHQRQGISRRGVFRADDVPVPVQDAPGGPSRRLGSGA